MKTFSAAFAAVVVCLWTSLPNSAEGDSGIATGVEEEGMLLEIPVATRAERQVIADLLPIDQISDTSVFVTARPKDLEKLARLGIRYTTMKQSLTGCPVPNSRYHDYQEMTSELARISKDYAPIAVMWSIGRSLQGRDIWALRISTNPRVETHKPGVIFLGLHHAREHLSAEVPLYLANYLVSNYGRDANVTRWVNTREIMIVPMVNPDGAEYDQSGGTCRMWRKNLASNQDGTIGVDLNRNYGGPGYGGQGSSGDPESDIYHGPAAFSEPETRAVRDFVRGHSDHVRLLLSFHTFSQLILYPWGHSNRSVVETPRYTDPAAAQRDLATFQTMAQTMARWNGYTPQQSSDLYIASGDTVDWAYAELGILAFTFELYPKSQLSGGGFYPPDSVIEKVAQSNLGPALYMIDLADNPYRVVGTQVASNN